VGLQQRPRRRLRRRVPELVGNRVFTKNTVENTLCLDALN
jgi:hypothetical protein